MDFARRFAFESRFRASIVRMQPPTAPQADATQLLASARRTLQIEARAIEGLQERLDAGFAEACRLCLGCKGRVVVTGMGKSGHVARKVASTLASTGTPAFFLHPAEAAHGDLGMITQADLVIAPLIPARHRRSCCCCRI